MRRTLQFTTFVLAASLAAMGGCTAMKKSEAVNNERRLVRAGFEKKLAENEKQETHLAGLPQRKIVKIKFGDQERYVYADAKFCNCIYTGNEEDFKLYYKILRGDINSAYLSQTLVQTPPNEAPVSENVWGAWGP